MKKLELKEARAPYNISLDEALLTDEVVILEKGGQPVAVLVPMAEYAAFQAWGEAERLRQRVVQPSPTNRHQQLSAAAKLLLPDYSADDELTLFTALDGEDFREKRRGLVDKFRANSWSRDKENPSGGHCQ